MTLVAERPQSGVGAARGLFVGDLNLGHRTVYENIKAAAAELDPSFRAEAFAGNRLRDFQRLPLPGNVRAPLVLRRQVRRLVEETRPDYLVADPHMPVLFCQGLMARLPTAVMLDATPIQFDELRYWEDATDRIPGASRVKYRLVRRLFQRAAAILPRSTWAARSFVEDYGVPPERVHVTPPGVDTRAWHPAEKPERETVEILFVGGDFERKGGPELREWFRERGAGRAVLTLVTGAPVPEEPGIRVVRAESNSDVLRETVRSADVFCLPTKADCFSHATCEAMASGLPTLVTDVGGIPDLVADGVTGFLIPPGDSRALADRLERLVASPHLRREMGEAARERAVAKFDSRRAFERIRSIGETIVRQGAAGCGATMVDARRGDAA